jgi:hypothetical protein
MTDQVSSAVLGNYLRNLINLFFKILPLKESGEPSLDTYMRSLQAELLGCNSLVETIHNDAMFLSLVSILQYLIDTPEVDVPFVRREVFKAISICNKLIRRYASEQEVEK